MALVTGCIPCLRKGKACGADDPDCKQDVIAHNWKCGKSLTPGASDSKQGAEYGWNMFVRQFLHDPEYTGVLHSQFWHDAILQACSQSEPLFYLSAAVGLVYESRIRSRSLALTSRVVPPTALKQCNEAINMLVREAYDPAKLEVTLISCIILIYFESMQGHMEEAVNLAMQSRQILDALEQSAGKVIRFIDMESVRLMLDGLDVQAQLVLAAQQGPHLRPSSSLPLLPLLQSVSLAPLEKLTTLNELSTALHRTQIEVFRAGVRLQEPLTFRQWQIEVLDRQSTFIPWLVAWREQFDAVLLQMSNGNDIEDRSETDLHKCAILEANWRTILILVKADHSLGVNAWNSYVDEFRLIEELCAPWINLLPHNGRTRPRFPFAASGLSVKYPLFLTMCRCPDQAIRLRACKYLLAHQAASVDWRPRIHSDTADGNGSSVPDSSTWTPKDWLDFVDSVNIEYASAVFLAGLDYNIANVADAARNYNFDTTIELPSLF